MTKRRRQWRARKINKLCVRHNTPLFPMNTLDASACSLGCVHGETRRLSDLKLIADMRRWYGRNGWEHE